MGGREASRVGRDTKTSGDKCGIAARWRKVSRTCSPSLQLFPLPLTNRCFPNRPAPLLAHFCRHSLHPPVTTGTTGEPGLPRDTKRSRGRGFLEGSRAQERLQTSRHVFSQSHLCCKTYPHGEYPCTHKFRDARCPSGYRASSHLK